MATAAIKANAFSAPTSSAAAAAAAAAEAAKGDLYTFTIGKVDAGMAILIGERASLIEFPSILLPHGVTSGSVVNIRVHRNEAEEERQRTEFEQLQDDILSTFGQDAPKTPQLRLRNVTQTSVTLEWDRLYLATAKLLSLDIYRNNQRLAPIPSPLHNTSTKLSGLDVNAEYTFHLVLRTTAGTFPSPLLRVRTHDIADTSGIAVCFGYLFPGGSSGNANDRELEDAAREALRRMGAREPTERIQIETTHFVCSDPRDRASLAGGQGPMYTKAMQLNIPVVQPHWIFACYEQKRMVPISAYYLENDPPNAATIRETIHRILSKDTAPAAHSTKDTPATPRGPSTELPAAAQAAPSTEPAPAPVSETVQTTRVAGDALGGAEATSAEPPSQPQDTIAGVPVITRAAPSEVTAAAKEDEEEAEAEPEAPAATDAEPALAAPAVDETPTQLRSIPSITIIAPASDEGDVSDRDHPTDAETTEDEDEDDEDEQHATPVIGGGGSGVGPTITVTGAGPTPAVSTLLDEGSESGMEDVSLGGDTPQQERPAVFEDQGGIGFAPAVSGQAAGSQPGAEDDKAEEEIDLR